jgi:hypothetical protein
MGKRVDGEVIPEIMRGRGSRVVVIKITFRVSQRLHPNSGEA